MRLTQVFVKEHGLACKFCRPTEFDDAVALLPKKLTRSQLAHEKKAIRLRLRVLAWCDKTIDPDPVKFASCHAPLCAQHIALQPQEGHHRCPKHTKD